MHMEKSGVKKPFWYPEKLGNALKMGIAHGEKWGMHMDNWVEKAIWYPKKLENAYGEEWGQESCLVSKGNGKCILPLSSPALCDPGICHDSSQAFGTCSIPIIRSQFVSLGIIP